MAALMSSPSTPPSHRTFSAFAHTPSRSSPLTVPADSSPVLSPTPKAHGGRRSQYKSAFQTSPTNDRKRSSTRRTASNPAPIPRPDLFGNSEETTGKKLLRDRFRARCLERALKERERKIAGKRRLSDWSSDGPDDMMDFDEDEDEDESMLNDPFFSRIMASARRKRQHAYRLSYSQDVGSSFDPDMEDPTAWEDELKDDPLEEIPEDLDDEELAAYAAERELLEGLSEEDIFSYSDLEDFDEHDVERLLDASSKSKQPPQSLDNTDVDMEM